MLIKFFIYSGFKLLPFANNYVGISVSILTYPKLFTRNRKLEDVNSKIFITYNCFKMYKIGFFNLS